MIDNQNWGFSSYKCGNLEAFLSMGASPTNDSIEFEYFLNKTKESEVIFQEKFTNLEEAIEAINSGYNHWKFNDKEKELAKAGCSTCQAH